MSLFPNSISGEEGGYTIQRSLRFRSSATAYLSRTPASAGNRKTWTWSAWIKRGTLSTNQTIFSAGVNNGAYTMINITNTDKLYFLDGTGTSNPHLSTSNMLLRDPSSWYHIVCSVNTTLATASDRVKFFVNGTRVSMTETAIYAQNYNVNGINNTMIHRYGLSSNINVPFDGYLTETNFIDGQALDPSYFGETDTDTGAWKAKAYTGSYGTNGFYLNFSNNSSTTTLGYDQSSNSNNWTTNNISLTAGSTYDSMQDVPTLTSASAGNYATLNAVQKAYGSVTYSNGNLQGVADANWNAMLSTINVTSGKWYWECTTTTTNTFFGVQSQPQSYNTINPQNFSGTIVYYANGGAKRIDGTETSYGAGYTSGDTIGVALDIDGGTITFYKNNSSQGSISLSSSSNMVGKTIAPVFMGLSNTIVANFGQRPFAYTPPTGYKALNTYNLPDPTIEDGSGYFNPVLYTGNGSTQSITGVGFQPDVVWIKKRSATEWNALHTSLLGTGKFLKTNENDSEVTNRPNSLTSFDSDGFTMGNEAVTNQSGQTFVAWNWKLGGSSGSTNTNGSITSSVSASTTSGMSVVTYTGTGSTGTVGHGLGATPSMVICQVRNQVSDWPVYHISCGATAYLNLNETRACTTNSSPWNNTAPTSSVFTVGSSYGTNWPSGNCVAWCFAPIEGFSAFGSYTANNSGDGPFIYTGFRPAFLMTKRTNTTGDWYIWDATREPNNYLRLALYPNYSVAEYDYAGTQVWDFLSNGVKTRTNSIISNSGSDTYIYAAFAENPFKYALAR